MFGIAMALYSEPSSTKLTTKVVMSMSMFFAIVKSRTIVYGFALATVGTFFIASGASLPDFFVLIRLTISVYFLALAAYLYNDLTDRDIDQINNRDTISSKRPSHQHVLCATVGFFIVSILLAFSINVQTGMASLISVGLAIVYSHPKTHLKNMFVVKTIITAMGGFTASMMGAFAIQNISYLAIASSLIVFMIYFINGPLNDIRDLEGDKKGGRKTIPIVIGVKKSFMMIIISISSIATVILSSYYFLGMHLVGVVLGLIICSYLILKIIKLSKNYADKKKMNKTRTVVRNSIFYIQISLFAGLILHQFLS